MTLTPFDPCQTIATGIEASLNTDAPTPWRTERRHSEITTILDANGRAVTLCRHEIAERIVAAVNGAGRAALAHRVAS